MRRLIVSALILTLMIPIGLVSASETVRVPDDFKTIQSAIDAAKAGDTIIIAPGIYREDIVIKKGISLRGAGAEMTRLIGTITIENVPEGTIDGFTIEGQGRDAHFGIWCSASSLNISNNTIFGYHHGIGSELSRMVIENNSVLRNFNVGIQIRMGGRTLIKGNTLADNVGTGIRIAMSENNVLINDNIITRNRIGIECIQSAPKVRRNVIEGNQIGVQSEQETGPDLGRDDDPGLNVIRNDGLQVVNTGRNHTIQAKNNFWGSNSGPDASSFDGKIAYVPWLETDPLRTQPVRPQDGLATTWGRIKEGRW